jgi:hypothetical protein
VTVTPGSWRNADCFRFVRHGYDPNTGVAHLAYAFDDGPELVESVHFPKAPWPADSGRQAGFLRALKLLHGIAGVSYYKASIPPRLDTAGAPPDVHLAAFLESLYVEGLAEFAFRNQVELHGRARFRDEEPTPESAPAPDLPERALVAMGGGKDSLVSLELLRSMGFDIQPACIGDARLIGDTVQAAGLGLLRIGRRLAPELAAMNEAGALNGHVPVTAINSAILLCAALLYGYRYVVFSNERSADEATLTDGRGRPVNHQYSKGLAFERDLRGIVRGQIAQDLEYFSLLRPLGELAICQRFSELDRYHGVFSSCNRNFHLGGARVEGRWCGDCPKCRGTTLLLAPWLPPARIIAMMGRNLLDEPAQEAGFRALCRLGAEKPFECVGTVDEHRAAMLALAHREDWKRSTVVAALRAELSRLEVPPLDRLLAERGPHCIPDRILKNVGF